MKARTIKHNGVTFREVAYSSSLVVTMKGDELGIAIQTKGSKRTSGWMFTGFPSEIFLSLPALASEVKRAYPALLLRTLGRV